MRRRTVSLIPSHSQEISLPQSTFGSGGPHHILRVVRDGEEALADCLRQGASTDPRQASPPDVRVLGLPLPGLHGEEIVELLLGVPLGCNAVRLLLSGTMPCASREPCGHQRYTRWQSVIWFNDDHME